MNACDGSQERITEFLHGELHSSERESVEQHLHDCPACQMELKAMQQTLDLLAREPRLIATQEMEDRFVQGVYRKIAADGVLTDVPSLEPRRSWLSRLFPSTTLASPRHLLRAPLMMAASLILGIWIGSSQFQPPETPVTVSEAIPRQTAQERLVQHWQQEMQLSLDEAHTQRYLRNDPMAALEQYTRLSELGRNDMELLAQVQVERQEMMRRAGI